eukprot:gene31518-36038_t
MTQILDFVLDPQFMLAVFTAIGVMATVVSIGLSLMEPNQLKQRMKAVALEREQTRVRERARLAALERKMPLRQEPKAYMKSLVDQFGLKDALSDEKTAD